MGVFIKGDSPFDKFIVSHITNVQTENIKFHNITFDCETIEDAAGNVFYRQSEQKEKWDEEHE